MTQTQLGGVVGVTKAMVSVYESGGVEFPPRAARKLVAHAAAAGQVVTFDDIYGATVEIDKVAA